MRKLSLLVACILGAACSPTDAPSVENARLPATFVGEASCRACHESEFKLWRESDHARAMQHATADTVLGDFSDVEFPHFDITSTFFRRNDEFYVRTDSANGALQDFKVAYTFGVHPLQQYLVEFPAGRLQTLPLAWDSRPEEVGGQRWFHIYPTEPLPPGDQLHWTGREQNWNYMCAECHSTNLAKNYRVESDSFDTNWSEINVSCEACHGPASRHVAEAVSGEFSSRFGLAADLDDNARAIWSMDATTGIAARSEPRMRPPLQPEACGRCHSRRSVLTAEYEFGRPLLDTHSPALLDENLYFPDGQIRGEVYVYGSFIQSRMYQAGVSCGDCHDPHSGRLLTGPNPNDVCATCHMPARFAQADHHRHQEDSAGCVDCHMPTRNYMVIDGRRDHSFRLPDPRMTVATGSPNACSQCHSGESADWAASALRNWFGEREPDHFGFAIHAARVGDLGANTRLREVIGDNQVPGIARGTALSELQTPYSQGDAIAIQSGLGNADPFVRIGALRALNGLSPDLQVEWAAPLLEDRLRAVRIEAARSLSPFRARLPLRFEVAFKDAEREFVGAMQAIAERPEAHANLANSFVDAGRMELALKEFQTALALNPQSVLVRTNFADFYRRMGQDSDAETLLREGIASGGNIAPLRHSLGLLLIRSGRDQEGILELRLAAEAERANARYLYVYAVAMNSLGQPDAAIDLLSRGKEQFPADYEIHWALTTILRDQNRLVEARQAVQEMVTRYPDIESVRALHQSLNQPGLQLRDPIPQ